MICPNSDNWAVGLIGSSGWHGRWAVHWKALVLLPDRILDVPNFPLGRCKYTGDPLLPSHPERYGPPNDLPHFAIFVVISVVVGVPLGVGVGWLHLKRTPAYLSEIDIGVEANPYYYKLAPGHQMEVFAPINLELLRQIRKIMKSQKLLSDEEEKRLAELEGKMERLLRGGYVGSPKRKLGF